MKNAFYLYRLFRKGGNPIAWSIRHAIKLTWGKK